MSALLFSFEMANERNVSELETKTPLTEVESDSSDDTPLSSLRRERSILPCFTELESDESGRFCTRSLQI